MRSIMLIGLLSIFLVACPRIRKGDNATHSAESPTNGWPAGYVTWNKINPTTLTPGPDETKQIARELYAQVTPNVGVGSVLVKEQFTFVDGAKGALKQVAVMRRTAGAENNGWEFLAFDPTTRQRVQSSQCVGCHVIQEDNDYMFSNRAAILAIPPR